MPKTPKVPPLTDWLVVFADMKPSVTVRATSLRTPAGWLFLDDAAGDHLLAVPDPAQRVAYVKRLEPGQETAEAQEAPKEEAAADPVSPAAEKVASSPARRRRA